MTDAAKIRRLRRITSCRAHACRGCANPKHPHVSALAKAADCDACAAKLVTEPRERGPKCAQCGMSKKWIYREPQDGYRQSKRRCQKCGKVRPFMCFYIVNERILKKRAKGKKR